MENLVLTAALRLLKYRSRSCKELRNRLTQKGYSIILIEKTIDYLLELDYLDDLKFAKSFVEDKINQKGVGPIYLKSELSKHGIPQDQISIVISEAYEVHSKDQLIKKHIEKRKNALIDKSSENQKRKIIHFLQRKGFSWNQISSHIDESFHY